MMEQLAAIMLLISCSDDMAICNEVEAPQAAYATQEICETQIGGAIRENASAAPLVLGKCVTVNVDELQEDAWITWDINPAGELVAAVEFDDDIEMAATSRYAQAETSLISN
ncbi:hypothetical protein [Notoacmeibacter sp. MSK16QG-6]|uniref:hypothetical protein n=1 Tax=Notoacmeibacter sp. MSK16QG-6 TaxID=2957982 RepID=UPI00209C9C7D|nr:hypothetical protein [Notoacmeibacter sp. MSK16QG-6]MCP1199737.1 hypothetical protein [Notoacmeibacter sp. MSK16QG-6]